METIISYVNNIFESLPSTKQLIEIKENITNNMLDKYQELKEDGKSEHEAIGIVISEFGNIEELLEELGIDYKEESKKSFMPLDSVKEYLSVKRTTGLLTTIGVALCIFGVLLCNVFDLLLQQNIFPHLIDSDGDSILSTCSLFLCVAIAVGLFIYNDSLTKKFAYVQQGVTIDAATKHYILKRKEEEGKANTIAIIIGVILCILSPVTSIILEPAFGANNDICDLPMLFLILIAVSLFVYSGCRGNMYDSLLRSPQQYKWEHRTNTLYGVINGVIMLLAVAIYLIAGFCFNNWVTSVVVFVIGGILCGIASTIIWGCTKRQG